MPPLFRNLPACTRAAAVAGVLAVAAVAASRPAAAMSDLGGYGPWSAFSGGTTGGAFCGMRTRINTGGLLALTVDAAGAHLIASDPRWSMPAGASVPIVVTLHANRFRGSGRVLADGRSIAVDRLPARFLQDFINGYSARFRFGVVRWSIDLTGTAATGALVYRCARAIGL